MIGIYCSNFSSPKTTKLPPLFQNSSVKFFTESQSLILKNYKSTEKNNCGIALFGELFSIEGNNISDLSDAEKLFVHLESKKNIDSANCLFVSAYFNENTLTISNDRIGTYPVYIFQNGISFIISTDLKEIISSIDVEFEESCIDEYLVLGFLLQPKTAFKNIRRLQPGSSVSINFIDNEITEKNYFIPFFQVDSSLTGMDFYSALEIAIKRSCEKESRNLSAALTGGWDSRLTWSFILKNNYNFISSFSHGISSSNDIKISRLLSTIYGINHREITFDYQNLINFSLEPTYFLHGFQDFTNLHLMYSYGMQNSLHDSIIDSAGSEFFRRYYLSFSSEKSSIEQMTESIVNSAIDKNLKWKSQVTSNDVKNSVFNELKMLERNASEPNQLLDLFYLRNRLVVNNANTFQVNHVISRMPFLDNDLIDLGFKIKTELKQNNKLHLYCLNKNKMSMRFIPVDHAGEWTMMTSNRLLKYGLIGLQRVTNKVTKTDKNNHYLINHQKMLELAVKPENHQNNLNNLKNKYFKETLIDQNVLLRLNNIAATQSFINK